MKYLWIARAIALFVVSFLSIHAMLQHVVDMRGGCDFIKPYHFWNMIFCSATAVIVFETAYRFLPVLQKFPWPMQWLAYIHLILIIVFLALPLADCMALHHEKSLGEPFMSDMGYGWYYWDDSGMGMNPITGIYLIYFFLQPFRMVCFLAGTGAVFALCKTRH